MSGPHTKDIKPQSSVQKPSPETPEKGILTRLLGFFKKNK
jgi:hypothetical protein